jgi:pyruvate-ferredoxin/flavodoxin oxidoreductase
MVGTGYWPLYHFDPRDGQQPFHLDSREPKGDFRELIMKEARFNMLARSKPEASKRLMDQLQNDITARWQFYSQLAGVKRAGGAAGCNGGDGSSGEPTKTTGL